MSVQNYIVKKNYFSNGESSLKEIKCLLEEYVSISFCKIFMAPRQNRRRVLSKN